MINREGGKIEGRGGLLRNKSGRAGDAIGAKEHPVGVHLRGVVGFYLITRKGREDQKEGEKEAKGKVA